MLTITQRKDKVRQWRQRGLPASKPPCSHPDEIWRYVWIAGRQFKVSSEGRVWAMPFVSEDGKRMPGKLRRLSRVGRGYLHFGAREGSAAYVHRAVARAFHGPPLRHQRQVDHRDVGITNNTPHNLRWCSAAQNAAWAKAAGRYARGELCGAAKLTENAVREIRRLYAAHAYTQAELGDMFGVTPSMVSCIVKRKSWKHVR